MHAAQIKPISAADFDVAGNLARTIWRSHYSSIISTAQIDYMLQGRFDANSLREYLCSDACWFDLLFIADQPVGYCSYALLPERGEMKLEQLYLAEKYRGQRLGQLMLRHIESRAINKNQRVLVLQVNKHNTDSIAFYRKAGFVVREEAVFDIGNGYVMDDYVMEKSIS